MKKIIAISLCVLSVIIMIGAGVYFYRLNKYRSMVKNIIISEVDISKVPDGEYKGEFDAIYVAAEVTILVKDGAISEIVLDKHKTDEGRAAEVVIDRVVSEQSLMVDTVSGATNSSKVILKSIEKALTE